jgi:site-specific DNA recombinase
MKMAVYARVSSDLQAEKGTIEAQLDYLRKYAALNNLDVAEEYTDEAVTGPTALAKRPAGKRLLEDARLKKFSRVIFYRVDRFARSLYELLDAERTLAAYGVTLKSASEEFDTSTAMGRAIFQILGVLSELEKSTIAERTGLGRQRKAREGKWSGVIPLGYMIAPNGKLVPSDHRIEALGMTEAEFVRDLFQQVADGSSLMEQCRRLEGVPTTRRYNTGKVVTGKSWSASRLSVMLSSTTYLGQHVYHGRYGEVIREVPPLVSRDLFNRVRQQLRRNLFRPMSKGRFTLLRGLVRCKNCGAGYVRTTMRPGKYYYRCLRTLAVNVPDREKRCKAGYVAAEKLEAAV